MRLSWGMASAALGLAATMVAGASAAQGAGGQPVAKITVETHEGYMKTLSTTNAALGMKIMSNDLAGGTKDAQQIATIFGDIEKFWAQNNKQDGVMWAQQGRQAATEMAGALGAGDATKAQAARKQMQGSCASCHMAYREGTPQTGYTLKAGVVTP